MRWGSLLVLSFFYSFATVPIAAAETSLFHIDDVSFRYERYKWGNELFLLIEGRAEPIIHEGTITASISYFGQQVRSKQFALPSFLSADEFSIKWGPLNQPYERILAGKYDIRIAFVIENQNSRIRDKVRSFLGQKQCPPFSKTLYWKTESDFAREQAEIKEFYRQRIRNLGRQYEELMAKSELALSVWRYTAKDDHPFATVVAGSLRFEPRKWRLWLEMSFQATLQRELGIFRKFHQKLFCRRHAAAKTNIQEFIYVLLRYGRLMSMNVYLKHKVEVDVRDSSRIDPFGMSREQAIVSHLEKLLRETIKTLDLEGISLPFNGG